MYEQECVPFAPALIESMRSLGYSFHAAIADLIDNSISAKASEITILSYPNSNPSMVILDNGCGMDNDKLYEAMRYGSHNPLFERETDDLGRFGLGMKSASLSQCRKLVVISKKDGKINGYSWDLDYVIQKGAWMLKVFSEDEIDMYEHIDMLKAMDSGTYIHLSEFDRVREGTGNLSETFAKCLDEMMDHLALVFHRYIDDDGLAINVNGEKLQARDPFLKNHKATQKKRECPIYIHNQKILLSPYILPHLSKLTQDDLDKIGGKEALRNDQGFYVYRNRRLIVWGTWFRLERKDELNKLARVMVDIPNSLDYMWSIDIKKSSAILPDIIRKNMYNAVYESVLSSESVHTYRGRKDKKSDDIEYIWERRIVRDGCEYLINRDIPQLKMLAETLDDKQVKMLDGVLKVLEEAFPVTAMYVDAAKGKIEEKTVNDETAEKLWEELQEQIKYIKDRGLDIVSYYKMFMKVEPYCNYEVIKENIKKELAKYE